MRGARAPQLRARARRAGRAESWVAVRIWSAEVARRRGGSRPEGVRVLDNAVEASLVHRSAPDGLEITVLPRLRSVTEDFYVTAFLLCDYYMQTALAQVGRG